MDSDLALAGSDQNLNGKQRSCQCFSLVKRRALYLSTVRNHYQRSEAELKSLPWLSAEFKCELVTWEFVLFVYNVCSSWVSSLMWQLMFSASSRISPNRCGFLQPQGNWKTGFFCLFAWCVFVCTVVLLSSQRKARHNEVSLVYLPVFPDECYSIIQLWRSY